MVFPTSRAQFSFPDHTSPMAGDEGLAALQSNKKLVTRTGATEANADIDIESYDLVNEGPFETGLLEIGGTSAIALNIESEQDRNFTVEIDLYAGTEEPITTVDNNDFGQLFGSSIAISVPVFSDRIVFRVVDSSGSTENVINGSVNINIGSATTIDAQLTANDVTVTGANGDPIADEQLDATPTATTMGLMTYVARALDSQGLDEFVSRVTDSTGTQIDPLTQDPLASLSNDELRARHLGVNEAGALVETQASGLDDSLSSTSVGQLTYIARALDSQGLDEFVSRVTDSSGSQIDPVTEQTITNTLSRDVAQVNGTTIAELINEPAAGDRRYKTDIEAYNGSTIPVEEQSTVSVESASAGGVAVEQQTPVGVEDSAGSQIDPDEAPEYPNKAITNHDLIADGDLVIGPVSVERAQAILVAVNSTDGNTLSVSATFTDGAGNTFQSQSASDLGMANVTEDNSRLIRKGSHVQITFTDTSGASVNNINAFVDAHR